MLGRASRVESTKILNFLSVNGFIPVKYLKTPNLANTSHENSFAEQIYSNMNRSF
jgi:hypothetical protein